MEGNEKLIINSTWSKCIKLPTFSVYDRLNIADLIHFSGTNFTRVFVIKVAPAVLTCTSSNYVIRSPNR